MQRTESKNHAVPFFDSACVVPLLFENKKVQEKRTRTMANLAFAAVGGPPVRMNLPVPLQRPYAADPGTLTEWFCWPRCGGHECEGPTSAVHSNGMGAVFHGGTITGGCTPNSPLTDRWQHHGATAGAYGTFGDVDASCVHAIRVRRRESLSQQVTDDVGSPSRSAGPHDSTLGDAEVGTVPNGASGGAAPGGTGYRPASIRWGAAGLPLPMDGGNGFRGPPYEGCETKVNSPLNMSAFAWHVDWTRPITMPGNLQSMLYSSQRRGDQWSRWKPCVMKKFLAPVPNDWDPIRVYVSQELVRDMKDLKFGLGNKNTHNTCHRGISPFAVLQVSMDHQTKQRTTQERVNRATYLSTDDVRALEAEPGCCPASYHGMMNSLKRSIRLLTVLFRAGCLHCIQVQGVCQVLAERSRCMRRCRQN